MRFSSSQPKQPWGQQETRGRYAASGSTQAPLAGQDAQAAPAADAARHWQEVLPHLPENARLLWHALQDMGLLWRVLRTCGGQTLRIPRRMPAEDAPLYRALGGPVLARLLPWLGGTSIYVPRCEALLCKLRQYEIITAFSRQTAQGQSSTAAVALLARRHGLSDRRIWQILKKSIAAPPQRKALALLRQPVDSAQGQAVRHQPTADRIVSD